MRQLWWWGCWKTEVDRVYPEQALWKHHSCPNVFRADGSEESRPSLASSLPFCGSRLCSGHRNDSYFGSESNGFCQIRTLSGCGDQFLAHLLTLVFFVPVSGDSSRNHEKEGAKRVGGPEVSVHFKQHLALPLGLWHLVSPWERMQFSPCEGNLFGLGPLGLWLLE